MSRKANPVCWRSLATRPQRARGRLALSSAEDRNRRIARLPSVPPLPDRDALDSGAGETRRLWLALVAVQVSHAVLEGVPCPGNAADGECRIEAGREQRVNDDGAGNLQVVSLANEGIKPLDDELV